jgi:hypothetical protein
VFSIHRVKCGVDLLQTAFRVTLKRLVSIHQTKTPHLNRTTFMSALCKMLRIYSAKATKKKAALSSGGLRTRSNETWAVWDAGQCVGRQKPAAGRFWRMQGCTNVTQKYRVSFLFIYKVDLNYECLLPSSIFRSPRNLSNREEEICM